MREGWHGDDYLILFDAPEQQVANIRYSIDQYLPGLRVIGIRGWDDFIVEDSNGRLFSVPTVPLEREYLRPFNLPLQPFELERDAEREGRIKWYVQPLVFAGDPSLGPNVIWVTHEQHADLVKWWNAKYRELRHP